MQRCWHVRYLLLVDELVFQFILCPCGDGQHYKHDHELRPPDVHVHVIDHNQTDINYKHSVHAQHLFRL